MKKESRMEYVESVYKRYRESSKPSKTKILDELCNVNRKYAITKLRELPNKGKPRAGPKRKRPKRYGKPPLSLFKQLAAKLRADGIYVIEFAFPAVRSIENINVLTIPFRIW